MDITPTLYLMTFEYSCGHVAQSFTSDKNRKGTVQQIGHQCDICSGRLRRILREHTDKKAREF